jgi:hypothetical protein
MDFAVTYTPEQQVFREEVRAYILAAPRIFRKSLCHTALASDITSRNKWADHVN